jgi:hypothetical protein
MAWGASRKEEQRIAFVNLVGLFGFVEEIGGVGELRFEAVANFLSNLIAAVVDPGTDGGADVFCLRAEVTAHFSDTFFDDALYRAAPAGVEDADSAVPGVSDDDWQAVGGLDGEKKARSAGDESVACELVFGNSGDAVNEVGVNLAERDQGPGFLRKVLDQRGAIAFDGAAGGVFGEAQIAGGTRGEGMDEPGEFL